MKAIPNRRNESPAAGEAVSFLALSAEEGRQDQRRLRWALTFAVAAHLVVFAVDFPEAAARALVPAAQPKVYVIQQVRFKPPPPQPPVDLRTEQARRVPIPDPTPDEPEPVRSFEDLARQDLDLPVQDLVFIPDAPPPPPEPDHPLPVGGEVSPPVRISGPEPVYTEMARRARIQGTVIIRATIDRQGRVTDLQVLKALPLGLAESAAAAVRQWRFEPGTLRGNPVPVLYVLTVQFGLQ